tara:strand:- start:2151 stop:2675 length:525 start_codon:yes stop_codon:yes gene_type:complete
MPQTIKPMGLIHLPGTGPNNRFDFKNKGNNRANERVKGIKVMPQTAKPMGLVKKNGHYGFRNQGNNKANEEAAGVGIITKQNTTQDVKPGETTRQANKLHLGLTKKGLPARGMRENFADKKVKGKSRPGRVKRSGASCKGSVSSLRAKAKKYGGERGKMYHWCANMKSGRKKKK